MINCLFVLFSQQEYNVMLVVDWDVHKLSNFSQDCASSLSIKIQSKHSIGDGRIQIFQESQVMLSQS